MTVADQRHSWRDGGKRGVVAVAAGLANPYAAIAGMRAIQPRQARAVPETGLILRDVARRVAFFGVDAICVRGLQRVARMALGALIIKCDSAGPGLANLTTLPIRVQRAVVISYWQNGFGADILLAHRRRAKALTAVDLVSVVTRLAVVVARPLILRPANIATARVRAGIARGAGPRYAVAAGPVVRQRISRMTLHALIRLGAVGRALAPLASAATIGRAPGCGVAGKSDALAVLQLKTIMAAGAFVFRRTLFLGHAGLATLPRRRRRTT